MTVGKSFRQKCLFPISLVLVVASCASAPSVPTSAAIVGMDAKTLLMAPFNIVTPLAPELAGSMRTVSTALAQNLESHGKTVRMIGYRSGQELWKQSIVEVRASGRAKNFENAARVYARKIGEQAEFDAIVIPALFVQNARKKQSRVIRWDDAQQTLEYRGDSPAVSVASIYIKAASVSVYVLDRAGEVIHSKQMGIELMQYMRFGAERGSGYSDRTERDSQLSNDWQLVDIVPPIQDEDRVRASVASVMSPFLPEELPTSDFSDSNTDSQP
jgi:hypothetical protein